jgi:hypothetical protein
MGQLRGQLAPAVGGVKKKDLHGRRNRLPHPCGLGGTGLMESDVDMNVDAARLEVFIARTYLTL